MMGGGAGRADWQPGSRRPPVPYRVERSSVSVVLGVCCWQDGARRCFYAVGLQGVLARVFPIVGCRIVYPGAYFVRGIKIEEVFFWSGEDVPRDTTSRDLM
jgi:hypothetical protein